VVTVLVVVVVIVVVVGAMPVHRRRKLPCPATVPPATVHWDSVMQTPPSSSKPFLQMWQTPVDSPRATSYSHVWHVAPHQQVSFRSVMRPAQTTGAAGSADAVVRARVVSGASVVDARAVLVDVTVVAANEGADVRLTQRRLKFPCPATVFPIVVHSNSVMQAPLSSSSPFLQTWHVPVDWA
jgi:hypothetical protein